MPKGENELVLADARPYPCELALGNVVELVSEVGKGAEGGGEMNRGGGGDVV